MKARLAATEHDEGESIPLLRRDPKKGKEPANLSLRVKALGRHYLPHIILWRNSPHLWRSPWPIRPPPNEPVTSVQVVEEATKRVNRQPLPILHVCHMDRDTLQRTRNASGGFFWMSRATIHPGDPRWADPSQIQSPYNDFVGWVGKPYLVRWDFRGHDGIPYG